MYSDAELLAEWRKNVGDFFPVTEQQRQEIYRSYEYRDSRQWTKAKLDERRDKATTIVNISAPLVRAVSGTEIMQDKLLSFVSLDPEFDKDSDIMDASVKWAQQASGYDSERSIAAEDAATCGIGAYVTYLDMTRKNYIAGIPVCSRIFPGFLYYDNSSRGSRLNENANWCGYGDPMDKDDLAEYVQMKLKLKDPIAGGESTFFHEMFSFSDADNIHKLDMLYHYFWFEYADLYDVLNPFDAESPLSQAIAQDDDVANMIGELANELAIDWQAQYWTFDKEHFTKFRNTVEAASLLIGESMPKLETAARKGKCYYRAEIAFGMVLSKARSYTQSGHMLNFITAYYDETSGTYYGLMRPLSFVQDALNESVSNFQEYAKKASHGGSSYIKGGAEALERLKKEKAHEEDLTPLPKDAEIIAKGQTNTPQVLVEFIRLMMEVMPRTIGLSQEFLGVITSGDMTDSLYGKVMRQSYAVLANLHNNSALSSKRQARIFEDIVRLMADANDGMILPVIAPDHDDADYIRLKKQNLAREYAIRAVERPLTTDEKQDTFNTLSQLAPQFKEHGINIMPILAKYANLDHKDRKELVELSTPKPQPPDPKAEALRDAQIRVTNAQAIKWESEAKEVDATLAKLAEEKQSIIDKNNAQAIKALDEGDDDGTKDYQSTLAKLDMQERVEMEKIKSKERLAEISARPATTVQFNAENALSGVATALGSAASSLEKMATQTMEINTKNADAMTRSSNAMEKTAEAMQRAAAAQAAPKRVTLDNGRTGEIKPIL